MIYLQYYIYYGIEVGDDLMDKFKFKKKYGQNFLTDKNLVKKIAHIAGIEGNSLTIEVGPGKAILTKELLVLSNYLIAYEIDLELRDYLTTQFMLDDNIEIIFSDFLQRDISKDINKYNPENIYFVSNVPYYITTPILIKLIESKIDFKKIVMMVQEEVGERFSATPGNKNYGSITVLLNYYYDIKREIKVNRNMFIPRPNVDSEVISLTKKENKLELKDEKIFFKLIKDSFKYKRKNIKNNLKNYDLNIIEKVLRKNNFNLTDRAEQLSVDIFVNISNELS